jgi:hypothetical protein
MSRGKSSLAYLADRIVEQCNGRINRIGSTWVFAEDAPKKLITRFRSKSASGREIVLIRKAGVHCTNPGADVAWPKSSNSEHWFVPWSVCSRCREYRRGGNDGLRYPHCNYERKARGGTRGAAWEMEAAMKDALKMVDDLMGRKVSTNAGPL